ncbi:MAG: GNAT family N-acetyltransferase [Mycobacteriales bacterium]|nr:GNAT family N-acetyltransferase [Mycobacteriales bacterium]
MDALALVDAFGDAAPRRDARVEEHGSLRVFVPQRVGRPWSARPVDAGVTVTDDDVRRVGARQRALGLPESIEWVGGRPAGLEDAARAAGLVVHQHPLLAVDPEGLRPAEDVDAEVRLLGPGDDVARADAVARIAFTDRSSTGGVEGLDAAQDRDPASVAVRTARVLEGRPAVVAAYLGGEPVACGTVTVVGDVAQVTGVATLPALRRRGLGGAVTRRLAEHAFGAGARLVFLAADPAAARVYERLGFDRVGSGWLAGPPH